MSKILKEKIIRNNNFSFPNWIGTCFAILLKDVQILKMVVPTTNYSNCLGQKITPVTPAVQHAEGPHWDPKTNVLYYVDTFKATVYRWNPKTGLFTYHNLNSRDSIGTITPMKCSSRRFIISADRFIYEFEWDGLKNNSGKVTELIKVEEEKPQNQFNDGKADLHGNLWLGTLTRQQDLSVSLHGGSLYQIILHRNTTNTQVNGKISNTSISNGLAWSKDNKYLFYIDSSKRTIEKWRFYENNGGIDNMTILFDLNNYPNIEGIPDGLTIDTKDILYAAIYGGSSVLVIDSNTGTLLQTINMPVKYVTSVAFGGRNLDILYVTTSRQALNTSQLLATPNAGCVFAITGLPAQGLPMNEVSIRD